MPVLFVGHGNPIYTLTENEFSKKWDSLSKSLPVPRAILCISAHWETKGTSVTTAQSPETIHDFGGFPEELYAIQYQAQGSPELAKNIIKLVSQYNISPDDNWGLGSWMLEYNEASISKRRYTGCAA